MLSNYHDSEVVKFLEFGFPINCQGNCSGLSSERNHTGATNFPDKMEKYLKKGMHIWGYNRTIFQESIQN
jgi:hypothetical protein